MTHQNKYIDLFSGCGGLSLGLHNSGWIGVFAVEKSPDAFNTLKHNLISKKKHFNWPKWLPQTSHDIEKIIAHHRNRLIALRGQIDLVTGGPPCQGFSSAGRRLEGDKRNGLVNSYIKFIKLVRPKVVFFENVKGFTQEFKRNRDKGRKYSSYVETALTRAGYSVRGELINFADYGIPQNRTRFILIGIRLDLVAKNPEIVKSFFEILASNKREFLKRRGLVTDPKLKQSISDLLKSHGTIQSPDSKGFIAGVYSRPKSNYQKLLREGSKTNLPDSHRFANHTKEKLHQLSYILKTSPRNKPIPKEIKDQIGIKKHTLIPLDGNEPCPTVTTLPDDHIHYAEARILTVRECARVQSFPDWFEFKGKYTTGGKKRTKEVPRYTQVGNAVPPLFAEQCGLTIKKLLKK